MDGVGKRGAQLGQPDQAEALIALIRRYDKSGADEAADSASRALKMIEAYLQSRDQMTDTDKAIAVDEICVHLFFTFRPDGELPSQPHPRAPETEETLERDRAFGGALALLRRLGFFDNLEGVQHIMH